MSEIPQHVPPYSVVQRRLSWTIIVTNSICALVPHVYLSVIDPMPSGTEPLRAFGWGEFVAFAAIMAVAFVAGSMWNRKQDQRIRDWYRRLQNDEALRAPLDVRRDALNQAPRAATVTAGLWTMACISVAWITRSYRALIGVGLGGILSTTVIYLLIDLLWRPAIPLFFPDSDLSTAGAFRLPVLGRLLIVFFLIGVLPPALLASLTWSRAQALIVAPNPQTVLSNLSTLQIFVLACSVVASIGLAVLVTRGITHPLDRLHEAMERIGRHDFEARVPVRTNDELGYLAVRFNEMAAGLQERERIRAAHQEVEQELAVAGQIQASFLPHDLPRIPGWQIAVALDPAKQTSGDFYDVIPLPEGKIGIVVADVADKGTGAALFMALSRTLIRTFALEHADRPAQVLEAANRRILADAQSGLFVTTFYGVIDPETGSLAYCNAGHNPPYLIRAGAADVATLCRTGMPLGVLDDAEWQCGTEHLGPGDTLVIYSDGLTEAHDENYALYEAERLLETAQAHAGNQAIEVRDALISAVNAFRGTAPQSDDMTVVVVFREPA